MELRDRTVVIIGASGGIGSAFARLFGEAGANLVLSARTESKLLELREKIGGNDVLVFPADATDPIKVNELFEVAKKRFGKVDAVVIAAGTWKRLSIDDPADSAVKLANDHFKALFLPTFVVGFIAQRFFRDQGQGLLINISSHAAIRPNLNGNLTYGPMKAACRHFILALSNELKGSGVRLCDIQPAIVNTPDNAPLLDTPEKREKAIQPEEIAEWVMEHFDDPNIPAEKLFDSKVILK